MYSYFYNENDQSLLRHLRPNCVKIWRRYKYDSPGLPSAIFRIAGFSR